MKNQGTWVGKKINGYRIQKRLGTGAIGYTFKAINSDREEVAIKIFWSDLDEIEPESRRRFEREIRILRDLKHPHILRLKDYGSYEGRPYLVTDFMGGSDLRKLMDRSRDGLDIEDVLRIFSPIATAVDYAHGQEVVHRDLKPENIVLQETSDEAIYPYLSDFGIATIKSGTVYTRTSTTLLGTYNYMAPEMWKAGEKKTYKVDIYAMGVMLYEALEGRVPFKGNELELGELHRKHKIPYPHNTGRRYGRQVAKVLLKSLAKDPRNRFQSAGELIENLKIAYESGQQRNREEHRGRIMIQLTLAGLFVTLIAAVIGTDWFLPWIGSIFFNSPTQTATMATTPIPFTTTFSSTPKNTPTLTSTPPKYTETLTFTETRTKLPTSTPVVLGETIGNLVWLRTGPGENYSALATYGKGVTVTIFGKSEDGNWLVVIMPNQTEGWVSSTSVQTNSPINYVLIATAPPTETPKPTPLTIRGTPTVCEKAQNAYKTMLKAIGSSLGDPNYNSGSDLNSDGKVDLLDYNILLGNWPEGCPSP